MPQGSDRAYLDHNATSPLRPEVRAALWDALDIRGNPSSVHADGRAARKAVEAARASVARLVGTAPAGIVFTAGGTEANNLALRGAGRPILASAVEHDSVRAAAPGGRTLPVDGDGVLDLAALARHLDQEGDGRGAPALVSIMLVNNETGVIQPVAEAAALAHARGALLHCDAVQAAGRIPIDMRALGADLLTLSAHKLGGPKGVGALALRPGLELAPLVVGGGQERRLRAGTENVAAIVGFGRAADLIADGANDGEAARLRDLRDSLEARLRAIAPDVPIHGAGAPRVGNTSCVGMPGVPSEVQVMALDLAGVSVSAGSACSSGKVKASHVLTAMGVPPEAAGTAIRVSLGWTTGVADVDRFIAAWAELRRRRSRAA